MKAINKRQGVRKGVTEGDRKGGRVVVKRRERHTHTHTHTHRERERSPGIESKEVQFM